MTVTETDLGIISIVVVILATLVYRIFRKEPLDRLVRLGVFIERKRASEPEDTWTPDPLSSSRDQETKPVPIPPPTPPPPLPTPDDSELETKINWPQREETHDP